MPRARVFTVGLPAADREFLVKLTTSGTHPARMIMRARVLLELDENAGPVADRAVIADRVGTSENTVRAVAKRFAETDGDVLATIGRKPRETPPVAPIVTGEVEARLIALACSTPPEGYSRWSLRLLESHVALVEDLPDLDHSTIGRVLKNGAASSSEEVLDDPTPRQRRVRRPDGRRAGRLRPTPRSPSTGGVHGREALPTAGTGPRPGPRRARPGPERRQRVRPPRHLLDLRLGRTAARLAPRRRPTPPDQDRLGPSGAAPAHPRLPRRRDRRAGHGQPQHPHHRLALRGVRPRHGVRVGATAGDPPHPPPRLLAQHRRDRAVRPDPPVPRPAHHRPRHPQHRTRRLATRHQHQPAPGPVAIRYRRCPDQAPPPIPQQLAATIY